MGYNDWKNIYARLREHEKSCEHLNCVLEWTEAEKRLSKELTIDVTNQKAISKEKEHWVEVLKRNFYVVEALASNNIAFRGSNEKIDDDNNENFFSIIQMIGKFDPIMKEHLRRIRKKEIRRVHYLGHNIQNEMILLLAAEIKNKIIETVRVKYFSVILDCTPDVSREEQMTLIIRCVDVSTSPIKVKEFFVEFLNITETTGKVLFDKHKTALGILNLNLDDVRGQGYDNGSNMKGQCKGVQSRVLKENSRAFYTPCGCHTLNLALSDMAMSTNEATSFFVVIQRIYRVFYGSTQRWEVLKNHVKGTNGKGLTVKMWSDTRWESRVNSVRAIRFQASQIRDALLYLAELKLDSTTTGDAEAVVELGLHNFDFLVGLVVWETGFDKAKLEAEQIALELGIEPKFRETRVRYKKKFFDENARDEPIQVAGENFRVNYFLKVVDVAISTLTTRFEQFQKFEDTFGFLFNLDKLRSVTNESLEVSCTTLENYLKHDNGPSDIDALELLSELQVMRKSLPEEITKAIQVLEYIKSTKIYFSNAWVAYRILLTIPVTVATADRSFSKLKLIKNYLRSTITQRRLNGLAMLSIEKKMLATLDFSKLIDDFAHKKAKRI